MDLYSVFTGTPTRVTLDLADEVEAVRLAKAGDSEALMTLASAYAFLLRKYDVKYRNAIPDADERHSTVMWAFTEAVYLTREDSRVADRVKMTLVNLLAKASSEMREGMFVPTRTAQAYLSAISAAKGDVTTARTLAREHGLSERGFDQVRAAMSSTHWTSLEQWSADDDGPREDVAASPIGHVPGDEEADWTPEERGALVTEAFDAITDDETATNVIRPLFGFTEPGGDPVPVAEVAHRVGINRTSVWKAKERGLRTMRTALVAA